MIEEGKEKTKRIFPDVDSRYKFGFFKVLKNEKPRPDHTFEARFYLLDPKDVIALSYSLQCRDDTTILP